MTEEVVLELRHIHKRFPGVYALNDINFQLRKGEIHALLGENGAGKSTLIKVVAGIYQPDEGEIIVHGEQHVLNGVAESQALGISVIHQELCLVPEMSIAKNIFLGRESMKGKGPFCNVDEDNERSVKLLKMLGLDMSPETLVSSLSVAQQQMVEIAKALSVNADILVMDEPTSSLTEKETTLLFDTVKRLQAQGLSIIYISHRMEELFEITDRITVLRDGQYVGTKNTNKTTKDELISMMVGRELNELYSKNEATSGNFVLEVQNLSREGVLHDLNFQLRKGEILGISGLVGAGRTEMARCIFGADRFDKGTIYVDGNIANIKNVRSAMDAGIALVSEDRKDEGLVLIKSVAYNITLPVLKDIQKGIGNPKNEEEIVDEYVKELRVKTPSNEQLAGNLSGGNQQKVVIAKWLATKPKVLILDEPTRGVDVGARVEIYEIMTQLAESGVGVLMISSDLPEIINMSDRLLVMCQGRITAELDKTELSQERIMHYATGGQ